MTSPIPASSDEERRLVAVLSSLTRCRVHIEAGAIDPSPADMFEHLAIVAQLGTLDADTLVPWLDRAEAYVKRVCPQVSGEVS